MQSTGVPVWLLATVGEEGLGNLRGVNAALDAPPASVAAFVAVEGNYLGSGLDGRRGIRPAARPRARPRGPRVGGRRDAERRPRLARVVASIAAIPPGAGTSVNVGRIGGGEGINMRAARGMVRARPPRRRPRRRSRRSLARWTTSSGASNRPSSWSRDVLGDRPAGRIDHDHPLVRAAKEALSERGHLPGLARRRAPTRTPRTRAGIPAIAVGVTKGSGEHTPQEWIETGPIEDGVHALARTVERFEELSA